MVYVLVGGGRWYRPFQLRLWTLHCATCVYEGIVAHMRGCERFPGKVRNPVTELIMMRRDEASLLQ